MMIGWVWGVTVGKYSECGLVSGHDVAACRVDVEILSTFGTLNPKR